MDETIKKLMLTHHSELIPLTSCTTTFVAVFISAGVLEANEVQLIRAEKTDFAKNEKLYEILPGKDNGFEILLKAAREKKQSGLVNVLEKIKSLAATGNGSEGLATLGNLPASNYSVSQSGQSIERGQGAFMQQSSNPTMNAMHHPSAFPPQFVDYSNFPSGYGSTYAPTPGNFQGYPPNQGAFAQPPMYVNQNTQQNFGHLQQYPPTNMNLYPQMQPMMSNSYYTPQSIGPGQLLNFQSISAKVSYDAIDLLRDKQPLQVEVVRPQGHQMSFPDDVIKILCSQDFYKLPKNFKGYALVLNITEFSDPSKNRIGAHNDTTYMRKLWTDLGYQVTYFTGRIAKVEAKLIIGNFVEKFTDGLAQSSVVFVGSHGINNGILTSEGGILHLYKHIIYEFNTIKCPKLDGKAKLFFVQACQNFATDNADKKPDPPPINNTLVSFSVIPGYESLRDHHVGTYYTYCLAKVFMEDAWRTDLLKLLEKVDDEMCSMITEAGQSQLTSYTLMGLKQNLYFNLEST